MKRGFLAGPLLGLAGLLLLVPGRPLRAADPIELEVKSLAKDGRVLVSFTLANGFTDELRSAIRSGLPAAIAYEIELRRDGVLWFDRTIATSTVIAEVRFDNLTRQHQLFLSIDGRGEEPRLTEDEDMVRAWMTEFKLLPLFTTRLLEVNTEYYIRVQARTRPRVNWLLFWPWEPGLPTGYARFTFIP
jgi:hypothetical protein